MVYDIPDIYVDGASVATSPFDTTLLLTRRVSQQDGEDEDAGAGNAEPVACVRMSLEHAKVLTIMLRKALIEHERQQDGPINLHPRLCQDLGIDLNEEWG